MPNVSIIMSTYNNAQYLSKAIKSVLLQSYNDIEFIIINDNSIDNTEKIVHGFDNQKIVYIKNKENKGLVYNLNHGLKIAKGKYIARIDSDDWWTDEKKLEKQVGFLDTHIEHALVGTYAKVYDEGGKELFNINHPEKFEEIKNQMLLKNCFVHSSVLFRKDAAQICGNYNKDEKYVEDYGLWLRMGHKYKLANIPSYSVGYLLNQKGETQKNNLKQIKANLKLIKKYKNYYPNYFYGFFRWTLKYHVVLFGGLKFINKLKNFKL